MVETESLNTAHNHPNPFSHSSVTYTLGSHEADHLPTNPILLSQELGPRLSSS